MATLRNFRGKWYARSRWSKNGNKIEKLIPLRTSSKVTARERLAEVNKVEIDIKQGMEFSFPWLNASSATTVVRFTVEKAVTKWIERRIKVQRKKTIVSNKKSCEYFMQVVGKTLPLKSVTSSHIESYVDYLESLNLGTHSINIHLRAIKTMFRYYHKMRKIDLLPIIDQLSVKPNPPKYITDYEFDAIMKLDWLDDFYRQIFLLYRETGIRLREPMMSELSGNWVDIPNLSKSKIGRNVELDNSLRAIFMDLQSWCNNGYGSKLKDVGEHISKKFKKALREIGADNNKTFHSLRHTFAVRKLIQGANIYHLKLVMGHQSVTTTEIYSNMNLKRIAQDFPTIVSSYVNETKIGERDTQKWDTNKESSTYLPIYQELQA
tara:strand:+ start:4309 stop:5442 length:1134 start_codon:yes stop_codon:yes gene_type:complete